MISVVKKYALLVLAFGAFGSVFGASIPPKSPAELIKNGDIMLAQAKELKKDIDDYLAMLSQIIGSEVFPDARKSISSMIHALTEASSTARQGVEFADAANNIVKSHFGLIAPLDQLKSKDSRESFEELRRVEAAALEKMKSAFSVLGAIQAFGNKIHEQQRLHAMRPCVVCNSVGTKEKPILLCRECRNVQYCSRECQKADWKEHKKVCKSPDSAKK